MLTVLLATRNRAAILRKALEAFSRLQPPPSGWKMIVVDNGSTDETPSILASVANRLPLLPIVEPAGGKNAALNAALAFVEGDLIVFTDDDAFPHTDWLVELRKAADAQPGYSVFGGAIVPRWESPPPPWVHWLDPGPVYSLTDPLRVEGPVPPFLIFGPNMAVRTSIFEAGVRFDPKVGPRSSSYAMGSETELTMRLDSQGHKAWYVPTAVVEHFIRDDQLQESWVLKRAVRYGRGRIHLRSIAAKSEAGDSSFVGPEWLGLPRGIPAFFREELKVISAFLRSNERELLNARWKRNYWWGNVIETREWCRGRKRLKPAGLRTVAEGDRR